jgi:hypothetical protein|tara:strand:- start:154 stop:417 length:264 start_codon:yes stop_codon:yes gene_type:complete
MNLFPDGGVQFEIFRVLFVVVAYVRGEAVEPLFRIVPAEIAHPGEYDFGSRVGATRGPDLLVGGLADRPSPPIESLMPAFAVGHAGV